MFSKNVQNKSGEQAEHVRRLDRCKFRSRLTSVRRQCARDARAVGYRYRRARCSFVLVVENARTRFRGLSRRRVASFIQLVVHVCSQGKGTFGVTRSFIATRSGLLRWHEHRRTEEEEEEIIDEPPFADKYARAMDSSWYKRAVDQHSIEPESFVFSVPFDAADRPNPLVTATHAVFIGPQSGHKAPAAVVGLQFQHSSLASRFVNITSTCSGTNCKKNCASEALDCYILDNNGFVVISERHEHTGKFFGEIDGTIMDSLVQDRIYRKVTVTDHQGTCSPQESHQSAAPRSLPERSIWTTMAILGNFLWSVAFGWNVENSWQVALAFAGESAKPLDGADESESLAIHDGGDSTDEPEGNVEEEASLPRRRVPAAAVAATAETTRAATSARYSRGKWRSCEKKTDLYILQPDRLNTSGQSNPLKGKLTNCHDTGCERPFSVQKIRHTNLILLAVDTLCPCGSKQLSIDPTEALTEPGACIARRERLYRRRPAKCTNYHPEEMEIKFCGSASRRCNSLHALTIAVVCSTLATRLA